MVATVGSISIDLSTNTAKFTQGFSKSATTVERESARMSKAVNGFSKASRAASGVMSGFVGGLVAGGALAAIGSLTGALGKARQSLSDFEEIGNRAKATGLGTDTFQAISHGASLADVEQESLNKSLEIFAKNVGLAKDGAGNLYSSMIKLNPVLLQQILNAKDQETRLKLVADAMAKMTDATDKAALATAVFGRGGAEMVRVLDKGGQSIEKMKRDAAELGIIIPEDLIKRSGELDDKLTTLSTVIGVNMKEALAKSGPLLVKFAEAMVKVAQGANKASELVGKVQDIIKDTPKRMDDAEIIRTAARQKAAVAELNEAWNEYFRIQKNDNGAGPNLVELDTADALDKIAKLQGKVNALDKHAKDIKVTMDTSQARAAIDQLRSSDLAALWAEADGKPTGQKLPTVHHGVETVGGGNAIDPETGEKIERAIHQETEATNRVAARATDVYRGVQQFDTHSAGYFDRLGSQIDSGLQSVGRALSYNVPSGGGYATGGANSFRYSGNNSSGSWAGKQMTFGGNSEADQAYYNSVFGGRKYRVGGAEDASSITSGATGTTSGAVNVNVVVKPVMEGSRLSGQSTAEIKQAASAGANAALRAFYGR